MQKPYIKNLLSFTLLIIKHDQLISFFDLIVWKLINKNRPVELPVSTETLVQESHPHGQDLQHPWLGKPRRGLQILDIRMGFPRPSNNVGIDSISLMHTCISH